MGQGSPTVVIDAGWCDDSSSVLSVVRGLRDHAQVCAYDRAGLGHSDSQTGLRTSEQMAEQLHTLLTSANVPGPYLVVGHSLGGMNMLVFADRYPNEVVGVVLIDSPHPDQVKQWSALLPTPAPNEPVYLSDFRKGLVSPSPDDPNYPEPMDWDATLAQVRAVKSLGNIPLAVLVSTDPTKRPYGYIPDDLKARLEKGRLDLQKEYLKLSTDSSLVLAEHSGHYIQVDEPQVVFDAILKLVDKARQK